MPDLGPSPATLTCPNCLNSITTSTSSSAGVMAWTLSAILCFTGFWPCFFAPFCVDSLQNVKHKCPNCKFVIGRYRAGCWIVLKLWYLLNFDLNKLCLYNQKELRLDSLRGYWQVWWWWVRWGGGVRKHWPDQLLAREPGHWHWLLSLPGRVWELHLPHSCCGHQAETN